MGLINGPGTIFGMRGGWGGKRVYVEVFLKWTIWGKVSKYNMYSICVFENSFLDMMIILFSIILKLYLRIGP